MRVGIIGAVGTTATTIKMLLKHEFQIVGVLGHEPINKSNVSGLYDLSLLSKENCLPYSGFIRINDESHKRWMKDKSPDIIFAVGFSQLLDNDWLTMAKYGCVGFHPTVLPKGRGRAPVAWSILNEEPYGAATFFQISSGADSGPVFVQEKFLLEKSDDAESYGVKLKTALQKALDTWLPQLKNGIVNGIPQNENEATYFGKRDPVDGRIDWNVTAYEIDRLIKASTRPHPGAYTYHKKSKLIIWKSRIENQLKYKGVVGRVLLKDSDNSLLVQCGQGTIWLLEYEHAENKDIKVGDKLGLMLEDEIFHLHKRIDELMEIINAKKSW